MIDSHCHLDHEPLFSNLKNVLTRSKDIGVEKIERDQHRPIAARTGFDEMNKLDENKNQEEDLNTPTFLRRQKNG